jgi:hypothetical protein
VSPALVRSRTGRLLLAALTRGALRLARHGPRPLREVARVFGNSPYLMTCEITPFLAFEPDLAALSAGGIPIVLGCGERSRDYYAGRAGAVVAERLGVPLVEFPGGHSGYVQEPGAFAVTLRRTLAGLRRDSHL